jgi:hypothetical protein
MSTATAPTLRTTPRIQALAISRAKIERGPLLGRYQGWELRWRRACPGWNNVVLVSPPTVAEKRKYRLSWNGERLANSRDAALLRKHHPDVHNWVVTRKWWETD